MKYKLLVLGAGDLAQRLASQLDERFTCWGMRRNPPADGGSLRWIRGDATDAAGLGVVLATGFDAVVMTLTPAGFSDAGYRDSYVAAAEALVRASAAGPLPRRVLFVSSTSVYGQRDGEWVDESSPTDPGGFSGRRMLDAENILLGSALPVTVLRLAGIYGPGRERMISKVRRGELAPPQPVQWTNRIHADDAAGAMVHLLARDFAGPGVADRYCVVDNEPAPAHEVHQWLADRLGIPAEQRQYGEAGGRGGNKRVRNTRLRESGWVPRYPSFREGYGALLAAADND